MQKKETRGRAENELYIPFGPITIGARIRAVRRSLGISLTNTRKKLTRSYTTARLSQVETIPHLPPSSKLLEHIVVDGLGLSAVDDLLAIPDTEIRKVVEIPNYQIPQIKQLSLVNREKILIEELRQIRAELRQMQSE